MAYISILMAYTSILSSNRHCLSIDQLGTKLDNCRQKLIEPFFLKNEKIVFKWILCFSKRVHTMNKSPT